MQTTKISETAGGVRLEYTEMEWRAAARRERESV
jgi:hypothetical protein